MVRDRNLQRYQKFLRSLRSPDPRLCSCPAHIHPRPWVPPPCRTTKPFGVETAIVPRRSLSNPELITHSHLYYRRDSDFAGRAMGDEQDSESSVQHLYNEARILKDALNKIQQGDQLSKDAYNTVKKWSKKRLPEAEDILEKNRQRREQNKAVDGKRAAGDKDAAREEEELRAELRNLRELSESNVALLQENKTLMRKVQRLQQRIKRQEAAGRGSRDSVVVQEAGPREDYILLTLRKKYDDLLQYVLKVESENQKLRSLGGVSGEREGWFHDSEGEERERSQSRTDALHSQLKELRAELLKKDEYIRKCDQHLQTLKENMALQSTLKGQSPGQTDRQSVTIDPSTLEEEWTKRLIQTREMYDRAIQGYKDQVQLLQTQMEDMQKNYKMQIQELTEKLTIEQEDQKGDLNDTGRGEESNERQSYGGRTRESTERDTKKDATNAVGGVEEHELRQPKSTMRSEESDSQEHIPEKSKAENSEWRRGNTPDKNGGTNMKTDALNEGAEKYKEALDLIVQRLENLQIGRSEVETTVAVIKDTIGTCLQEWRESFHHEQVLQKSEVDRLITENEDLRKKLQGKSKKVESLYRKCSELEQEKAKLQHQYSLAESQIATAQATSQLDVLQGLPQKLQEAEQALINTRDLLHDAQAEKHTLLDQVRQLGERLSKKEAKLKAEREQSTGQEEKVAELQTTITSLHQRAEELERDARLLREQLTTKDALLEHTSAQLEERIRECARLASQLERYKLKQELEADRAQERLQDQDSASHKQFLEAQTQASYYQAQLSALRSEKEQSEKSLRSHIRKLEEKVDQLQLRNSTLQRQLNTITSTFYSMFSNVDLNPPTLGVQGSAGI